MPLLTVARRRRRQSDHRRASPQVPTLRLRRGHPHLSEDKLIQRDVERPGSDVLDVLAPGLAAVFCGINPGRVGRCERPLRQPAQRLLAPASRRRLHAAPLRPQRAVRAPEAGVRYHERCLPDDARLRRPASCGLRRLGGAAGAGSPSSFAHARSASSARRPIAAHSASGRSSDRRSAAWPRRRSRAAFDLLRPRTRRRRGPSGGAGFRPSSLGVRRSARTTPVAVTEPPGCSGSSAVLQLGVLELDPRARSFGRGSAPPPRRR